MALVLNDRVKETTTTTGTGTVNLAGAATGFETFVAGIGNSNTCYYAIVHQSAAEFEVGLGTVTDASPDTLARTTVISSSNSDSAVNFSAGTKDVFCTLPASKAVFGDASGNVDISGGTITRTGDLTLDVSGDITLDADGDNVYFKAGGGNLASFSFINNDVYLGVETQDYDLIIRGNDGGSTITALTLDMSDAGRAIFNGGIDVGGTSITKTGDLTLDVSGDIILDADGDNIYFDAGGGHLSSLSFINNDVYLGVETQDKDLIIRGNDGGSTITALTLDMSEAGTATFNSHINLPDNARIKLGASDDLQIYHDGSNSYVVDNGTGGLYLRGTNTVDIQSASGHNYLKSTISAGTQIYFDNSEKFATVSGGIKVTGDIANASGNMTIDVADDLTLDADGEHIRFKDGGTEIGNIDMGSNNLNIRAVQSDKDILFLVNDGGSEVTALLLDGSEAGAATFNNNVTAFSDVRLKSNIKTFENGLDAVEKLRGVRYTRDDKENIGVIAQEIEEILPEIVLTADDKMGTKSVDYSRLTAVLIEAVKDLSARVKELEGK